MKKIIFALSMMAFTMNGHAQENKTEATDSTDYDLELKDVVVAAQRPIVKMRTNKMTYNVQEDPDSKANNLLDMLRKVPMVNVDGQDNITVNGSSNFKVYVDGKPNPMMSSNPSQIFKSIPASMVKNIEVITSPGAKYDAEGTGGILNLTMNTGTKQELNGYNGSLRTELSDIAQQGSAYIGGQQGKLSFSGNLIYNRNNRKAVEVETLTQQQSNLGTSNQQTTVKTPNKMNFTTGNASLGYELDSARSINTTLSLMRIGMKNESDPESRLWGGIYGDGFGYGTHSLTDMTMKSLTWNVDYQHFYNKNRTQFLTLSYQLNVNKTENDNTNAFKTTPNASQGGGLDLSDRRSVNNASTTEHVLQADYALPFSLSQKLNFGAKYSLRKSKSDADYYLFSVLTPDLGMDYQYNNNILAGYMEHQGIYGDFSSTLGLRYEHTFLDVEYAANHSQDFSKNYGNLVPSATLSYSLSQGNNIGVNYTMRISRPGISYLNPYIDRSNPTALTYGNSDLDVEKRHSVELVYNHYDAKLMLNANLSYNFCNNAIEQYSFYENNLLNTTYGNMAESSQLRLNVYANWMLHKNSRLFLNGNVNYTDLRSKALDAQNHGWAYNLMAGLQQTLPWEIKLGAYFISSSKTYTTQGWNSGYNMIAANLSKSILKDRLTFTLTGLTGLDHGGMNIESHQQGRDFTSHSKIHVPLSTVAIGIAWNFGNMQLKTQQHKSRVSSDYMETQSTGEKLNNIGSF